MKNEHLLDAEGNPAGGTFEDEGIAIDWGKTTPEAVIEAAIARMRFYMDHPVGDNAHTVQMTRSLGRFKELSQQRKADREARGVRGSFKK
jgi:hypothetical protein